MHIKTIRTFYVCVIMDIYEELKIKWIKRDENKKEEGKRVKKSAYSDFDSKKQ